MENRTLPNEILLGEISSLLEEGREVVFTPKGTSMLPFIRGGRDSVTLKKMDQVRVGDIVLAHLPDSRYVLHRVVKVLPGDVFYIIGDNTVSGEYVKFENILGIMTYIQSEHREIDCVNDARYQRLVRAWWTVYPIRKCLLRVRGFLGKYKRRIAGRA